MHVALNENTDCQINQNIYINKCTGILNETLLHILIRVQDLAP